ncbi:MAG: RNA 2',3'-cyclic phosphodiesterase [Candidatus Micrarchaeaceae archaeon]
MRVFTAIELPVEIRKKLFHTGSQMPGRASIVPESNLHITLQFIGEIGAGTLAEVIDSVKSIKEEPFRICIKGISCFGSGEGMRVVYANALDENKIMSTHSILCGTLESRGISFEQEKSYIPHVTIGRTRQDPKREIEEFIKKHSEDDFGSFEARKIHVKGSTPTRNGPVYETLYENELSLPA